MGGKRYREHTQSVPIDVQFGIIGFEPADQEAWEYGFRWATVDPRLSCTCCNLALVPCLTRSLRLVKNTEDLFIFSSCRRCIRLHRRTECSLIPRSRDDVWRKQHGTITRVLLGAPHPPALHADFDFAIPELPIASPRSSAQDLHRVSSQKRAASRSPEPADEGDVRTHRMRPRHENTDEGDRVPVSPAPSLLRRLHEIWSPTPVSAGSPAPSIRNPNSPPPFCPPSPAGSGSPIIRNSNSPPSFSPPLPGPRATPPTDALHKFLEDGARGRPTLLGWIYRPSPPLSEREITLFTLYMTVGIDIVANDLEYASEVTGLSTAQISNRLASDREAIVSLFNGHGHLHLRNADQDLLTHYFAVGAQECIDGHVDLPYDLSPRDVLGFIKDCDTSRILDIFRLLPFRDFA